jgi:CRISPR/Cas system-associated exonuclease Cas4 (RecB family)
MEVLEQQLRDKDMLLSPTAINKYMRCQLQFYYRYVAGLQEPDIPDDEQELDNRIFGNIFHQAADLIYHQLPSYVTKEVLAQLLKDPSAIERAVDEAFRMEWPQTVKSGLHLINREVIIRYLRQLIDIDLRLTPFTILGLECDVERKLPLSTLHAPLKIGGRIDRLDQLADGQIRVVDYKTGSRKLRPLGGVDDIFDPQKIHDHADYYLQTFVYANIVSRQKHQHVAPALLFIQHASAKDYDPVLCFGKEKISDVADYSARFNELLENKVNEIFSQNIPFTPTADLKVCQSCPYLQICRR